MLISSLWQCSYISIGDYKGGMTNSGVNVHLWQRSYILIGDSKDGRALFQCLYPFMAMYLYLYGGIPFQSTIFIFYYIAVDY